MDELNLNYWPLVLAVLIIASSFSVLWSAGKMAFRGRLLSASAKSVSAIAMFSTACLVGILVLGTHGYQRLTHEHLAATLTITPVQPQVFSAQVTYPSGQSKSYLLAGDQVYVDARIIKWKPWLNVLGLHTAFELDRITGRYHRLEDEKSKPRTVYGLTPNKPFDVFEWHKDYPALAKVMDAEYGSGTYLEADKTKTMQVLVTTSGLIMRPVMPN